MIVVIVEVILLPEKLSRVINDKQFMRIKADIIINGKKAWSAYKYIPNPRIATRITE